MTTARMILMAALLPAAMAVAQSNAPAPAKPDNPAEAINSAPDPSSAIEAYARGLSGGTAATVQLQRAYVQHMVSHGAPDLADAQAHDLVNRGAADATARGVAAYNDAARGDVKAAVGNLRLALIGRPTDPFILRTAGQVVAWYDSQKDRSSLSKDDVTGIEWLRAAGKQHQEFADAYAMAAEALQPAPSAASSPGQTPATRGSSSDRSSASNSSGGDFGNEDYQSGNYAGGSYGSSNYGSGSAYSSYYPYSYSYPYYGYAYSYGAYSALALRDRDFLRDRPGHEFDPRNPPGRPDGPPPGRGGAGGPPPRAPQPPPRPPMPPGPPHP